MAERVFPFFCVASYAVTKVIIMTGLSEARANMRSQKPHANLYRPNYAEGIVTAIVGSLFMAKPHLLLINKLLLIILKLINPFHSTYSVISAMSFYSPLRMT